MGQPSIMVWAWQSPAAIAHITTCVGTGTPVSKDYTVPFRFTGNVNRVLVQLSESKLTAEDEAQIRRAKAAIEIAQ